MRARVVLLAACFALALTASAAWAANISCTGNPCNGTTGADTISGRFVDDNIIAQAGADLVYAKGGADDVKAGFGDDRVFGGAGSDDLVGGDNDDHLFAGCNGGCGAGIFNVLYGGDGGDTLGADNAVTDRLEGGPGNDTCFGDWTDTYISCERQIVDGVEHLLEEPTVSTEAMGFAVGLPWVHNAYCKLGLKKCRDLPPRPGPQTPCNDSNRGAIETIWDARLGAFVEWECTADGWRRLRIVPAERLPWSPPELRRVMDWHRLCKSVVCKRKLVAHYYPSRWALGR